MDVTVMAKPSSERSAVARSESITPAGVQEIGTFRGVGRWAEIVDWMLQSGKQMAAVVQWQNA